MLKLSPEKSKIFLSLCHKIPLINKFKKQGLISANVTKLHRPLLERGEKNGLKGVFPFLIDESRLAKNTLN
jgi:hypothetical protein